jgi:hypothetical protein
MFVVSVTYGTKRNMEFARVPNKEDAEALKKAAIERKYYDAKVLPAKEFDKIRQASQRGGADQGRAYRKAS